MSNQMHNSIDELKLVNVIGFEGKVSKGLCIHPDEENFVYPLGNTVVIKKINNGNQIFLSGHQNNISCLAVSPSGKYIVSGQINYVGFKADVVLWDYNTCSEISRYDTHKVKVESVSFSCHEKFLLSLGGEDDVSIVVYSVTKKQLVCGFPSSHGVSGTPFIVMFTHHHGHACVVAGNDTLRVWKINEERRKIVPYNAQMGLLHRDIRCIEICSNDEYIYAGTTTGDVLKIKLNVETLADLDENNMENPLLVSCLGKCTKKQKNGNKISTYSAGVISILHIDSEHLLLGTGEGIVSLVKEFLINLPTQNNKIFAHKKKNIAFFQELHSIRLDGGITSIVSLSNYLLYIGTGKSHVYKLTLNNFKTTLLFTSHVDRIFSVVFPANCSKLFATCSKEDVRIWHAESGFELLRIPVPNKACRDLAFSSDGSVLATAWNDGRILAFTPETGKLIFAISNAHPIQVTAIAMTQDGNRIISGGGEGQIRVWKIGSGHQSLLRSLHEHKGVVRRIKLSKNDEECISASSDGTCVIWDLRKQIIIANAMFRSVCYHPSECQIVTCASDRKLCFWETFDGSLIRVLEGSMQGGVNAIDISLDGKYLVSGASDRLIKVWSYEEGEICNIGSRHCGSIADVVISPDQQHIVSVGWDGAIMRWKFEPKT